MTDLSERERALFSWCEEAVYSTDSYGTDEQSPHIEAFLAGYDAGRGPSQALEVTPAYRIEVARRKPSDKGYDTEPYSAVAWLGARCVAVQYGSAPGIAFQKAWRPVQEDREREAVVGEVA